MWKEIELYVIEKTEKQAFHKIGWGGDENILTDEHIQALKNGKCIAWSDGEYTHILELEA